MADLRAPFPWFGGKSRVTDIVWQRFGDVPNYVEPFFGSGAVLLGRPHAPGIETVNDKDGFVSNFWRALQAAPDAVADAADNPVNENDLHARHAWLVAQRDGLTARLEGDPEYYDAKIAGWWVWGISCWIGSGWCSGKGPWQQIGGLFVNTKGDAGQGVNRKLPHLGDAGQGVNRQHELHEYLHGLADRLRGVRVCCGDWERVCGPSPTFKHGITGVFLDPPYSMEADRTMGVYAEDCGTVAHRCREWAIANGDNPLLRIALCGYDGEHAMPDGWTECAWKTQGGYGLQGETTGGDNSARERIWFSPHCLDDAQMELFA